MGMMGSVARAVPTNTFKLKTEPEQVHDEIREELASSYEKHFKHKNNSDTTNKSGKSFEQ